LDHKDLAIVLDIDMLLKPGYFDRCLAFTQLGSVAYFPVVFSFYNPSLFNEQDQARYNNDPWSVVTADAGGWREYGYGMLAAYAGDIRRVGGYNLEHTEWGYEDLDMFGAFKKAGFLTMRVRDTTIAHLWHPKQCEAIADEKRHLMCRRSKMAAESRKCNNNPDKCIKEANLQV